MAKTKDEAETSAAPREPVAQTVPADVAEALPAGGGSYTRLPSGELVRDVNNNQDPMGQKE